MESIQQSDWEPHRTIVLGQGGNERFTRLQLAA